MVKGQLRNKMTRPYIIGIMQNLGVIVNKKNNTQTKKLASQATPLNVIMTLIFPKIVWTMPPYISLFFSSILLGVKIAARRLHI